MRPYQIFEQYIGEHEIGNNKFTNETDLGLRLHEAGQKDTESWCCYAAEAVYKKWLDLFGEQVTDGGHNKKWHEINKLFNGNSFLTLKNFKDAAYHIGELPAVDWMVIFVHKKGGEVSKIGNIVLGHTGIVSKINTGDITAFEYISGNVGGKDTTGREGDSVKPLWARTGKVKDGLEVAGFVKVI